MNRVSIAGLVLASVLAVGFLLVLEAGHRATISVLAVALAPLVLLLVAIIVGKRRVIHARRRGELASQLLEREHLKLRTLLNALPQVIWLRDTDGIYRGCNRRFQELLGRTEEAIVGRRHADLGLGAGLEFLENGGVDGATVREVSVSFRSDGHEERLEVTLVPLLGADGAIVGVLGVGQDITERTRQRNELAAQRWRLDSLISGTRVGTWEWNAQTSEVAVNERWAGIIGYRLAELEPVSFATWERLVHPLDLAASNAQFERLFAREIEHYECEVRMRHKHGHWVWVLDRGAVASWTDDGRPLLVTGTHLDVSARKRADQERQELLERLQSIAAHVPGLIFQFRLAPDGRTHLPYASAGIHSLFGVGPEAVAESAAPLFHAVHPEDRSRVQERTLESARNLAPWFDQFRIRHPDGRMLWAEGSAAPVRQDDGSIVWHGHIRDVSRLKAHEQELRQIAHYDTLTGAPNRRLLMERLQQSVARARRTGRHLGVCYLDVDAFKSVNDRCGHAGGDQLLVELTVRLRTVLGEDDTLARLGGDEFVLLWNDIEDPARAVERVERVLALVREPVALGDRRLVVSASVGLTMYPPDEAEPDMLLRHADQAMYRAKNLGRDRYHVYDPEHDRANLQRRRDVDRLEQALDSGEFTLHYQPKVDLGDGTVIGAEALLRWEHPEHGLLLPRAFLGQVEGTELELRLGDWVVERALAQLSAWNTTGLRQVVSVNISPAHLMSADFAERMATALARHPDVAPGQLELEIMENATLSNLDEASLLLARCRSMGLRISLDDFGTGYASLSYLRRLPVDLLKIDQSFVRDMLHDPNDLGLVESVVRLAGAFNRPVIAEGVETLQHGAMLLRLGCRLAQGFGIGRPMPAEAFPAWIEDWRQRRVWRHLGNPFSDREDLFLDVVVRSHGEWAAAVLRRLHGEHGEPVPGRQQCQFGHWYHGIGAADFGASRRFRRLGVLHEQVHGLADQLLALQAQGDDLAVRAGVPAFEQARDRLLAELAALAAECSATERAGRVPATSVAG